jgi:CDP-diacylglycerol--serine O-phosphatidyltransferase
MIRFLVPNAITSLSIVFGALSLQASVSGRPVAAAWWILYCTFTDKIDGIAARKLKASSAFGMQLDSLADLVCFGVAPATAIYAFLQGRPELGWASGWSFWAMRGIALGYVVCAAVRLAKFNVISQMPGVERIYFGIPSTFAGGLMAALLATMVKYGDPAWRAGDFVDGWRLLGAARLDFAARWLPWALAAAGAAMVSPLRVPKLAPTGKLAFDVVLIGNVAICYGVGLAHRLPEYLAASALAYAVWSVVYHLFAPSTKDVKQPALFQQVG